MENIIVAIIGEDKDASEILFKGFKTFQPDYVILLIKEKYFKKIDKIQKDLDKFSIKSEYITVSNNLLLEETFIKIKEITTKYNNSDIIINVDTDYMSSCLALSSAFVNGITAIGVLNDEIITYPIMKFSYYNAINEKKQELLSIINQKGEIESMQELSKLANISLPLIAYHLKGNKDSKGLLEMNLIKLNRENGSLKISLTQLGKLIVSGNINTCHNRKLNK